MCVCVHSIYYRFNYYCTIAHKYAYRHCWWLKIVQMSAVVDKCSCEEKKQTQNSSSSQVQTPFYFTRKNIIHSLFLEDIQHFYNFPVETTTNYFFFDSFWLQSLLLFVFWALHSVIKLALCTRLNLLIFLFVMILYLIRETVFSPWTIMHHVNSSIWHKQNAHTHTQKKLWGL